MKYLISGVLSFFMSVSLQAETFTYTITPEIFHYHYRESILGAFFMENKGVLAGSNLAARYHQKQSYFDLSGRFAFGQTDYRSSGAGRMKNDPYHYYELRLTHGYPCQISPCFEVAPYLGLGYRYLVNDGRGLITSTGVHHAYFRSTKYIYMPFGADLTCELNGLSRLKVNLEFDFFAVGFQRSELFTATITNTQSSGHGFRGALGYEQDFDCFSTELRAFFRYWLVDDSDAVLNLVNGKFYNEPHNVTKEIGVGLSFKL